MVNLAWQQICKFSWKPTKLRPILYYNNPQQTEVNGKECQNP